MKTRRLLPWAIVVVCGLLLVGNVLAMRSDNYWLDWFIPLTGAGGGPVKSAHYAANFAVGQSVIGAADSDNYAIGLGYWYGTAGGYRIYLPLVMKSSS